MDRQDRKRRRFKSGGGENYLGCNYNEGEFGEPYMENKVIAVGCLQGKN